METSTVQATSEEESLAEQLRQAQAQLLQSEKLATIGQLAAGVAHEINNPIGYIGSNLSMLQDYIVQLDRILDALMEVRGALPQDHAARQALEQAMTQIDVKYLRQDLSDLVAESLEGVARVRKIVQDLKDFSHVRQEDWVWADLHHGLDSTLNIVNNELKYKAEVVKEYGAIPQVECLAPQLNQVFMNLLVNASHAISGHGTITIRTGMDGEDWVWVEISDTGCGIAPEGLQKIFKPFYTTKPVGSGTGLGLALAKDIVDKHRGRIEVVSEVGKGTTFRVFLPVQHGGDGEAVNE